MAPAVYPIALNLEGKRVLLVGGGEIADGKLDALLLAGAEITVVSPEVRPRIAELAAAGQIALHRREYESGDIDGTSLVIAATDDRPLNARVVTEARAARILTQAVDDIPYCDFFAVAIVRRRDPAERLGQRPGPMTACRMDDHARGLVDHEQVLVAIGHRELGVGDLGGRRLDGLVDRDGLARGQPVALDRRPPVDPHRAGLDQPLGARPRSERGGNN